MLSVGQLKDTIVYTAFKAMCNEQAAVQAQEAANHALQLIERIRRGHGPDGAQPMPTDAPPPPRVPDAPTGEALPLPEVTELQADSEVVMASPGLTA
jgi:hypothetical protein